MASIGDVLRHLVANAANLGNDHRAEFLDAINEAYPPPPEPEPEPAPVPMEAQARIAQLEAELAAAKAQPTGS